MDNLTAEQMEALGADVTEQEATETEEVTYTPVFDAQVRTAVYILTLAASVIGLGCMTFGHADIGGFISTAAAIIAGGFGVTYNPIRMAGK